MHRKQQDYKTAFVYLIMLLFMVGIVVILYSYFDKRNAIKVDGGRVNPYTSDYNSIDLGELENPDTETLNSMFKEFQKEMGQ